MMKKIYANGTDEKAFLEQLAKRTGETDKRVSQIVTEIIETVRAGGDQCEITAIRQFLIIPSSLTGNCPSTMRCPRRSLRMR